MWSQVQLKIHETATTAILILITVIFVLRYGPYHPEMTRKLSEMNTVILDVVKTISNKTLLMVLGDHGMTHTGDHGGETEDEINAGLFAYSPLGAFKSCANWELSQHDVVNQVCLYFYRTHCKQSGIIL